MSGKHWLASESWDYSLLVSQDVKNTVYFWNSFKKFPATLILDLVWFGVFIQGSLPDLSHICKEIPLFVLKCQECSMTFLFWFYVQGENARLTQRYSITTQLLVLYYVLSYEEALLASTKILGTYECSSGRQRNWNLDAKRRILTITRIHVPVRFTQH